MMDPMLGPRGLRRWWASMTLEMENIAQCDGAEKQKALERLASLASAWAKEIKDQKNAKPKQP